MITNPNAHGFCPRVVSQKATLKHIKRWRIKMETDVKPNVKNKIDYLRLAFKISELRHNGDEPSKELLQQAYEFGRLADVPNEALNNL